MAVVVFIVVDFQVVDVSVTKVVGLASPRAIRALLMALPITAKPNGSGVLSSAASIAPNGGNNEPWRPEVPRLMNRENSSPGCWTSPSPPPPSFLKPIPGLAVGSTLLNDPMIYEILTLKMCWITDKCWKD